MLSFNYGKVKNSLSQSDPIKLRLLLHNFSITSTLSVMTRLWKYRRNIILWFMVLCSTAPSGTTAASGSATFWRRRTSTTSLKPTSWPSHTTCPASSSWRATRSSGGKLLRFDGYHKTYSFLRLNPDKFKGGGLDLSRSCLDRVQKPSLDNLDYPKNWHFSIFVEISIESLDLDSRDFSWQFEKRHLNMSRNLDLDLDCSRLSRPPGLYKLYSFV